MHRRPKANMKARHSEVVEMDWATEFLPWFSENWQPGQHVAVIAPTGAGKSNFVGQILRAMRRYVLVLDAKGGDSTVENYGFERLGKWPGKKAMSKTVSVNDGNNEPSRYVIGSSARTKVEKVSLVETMRNAIDDAYEMGGWTVYADELAILTDPRHFNLRQQVDEMLIAARDRGLSFVGSFQGPAWVTPQASRQATWVAVSYTRDREVVDRLAEIMGRPKAEIRGALNGLERFSWLIVGRDPREPLRVTIPDYIEPKKTTTE